MKQPQIPEYHLLEELGRGGRGVVYRARRGEVNYAIKIQGDPSDRTLLSYGSILACIRHPGLPEVIEVGEVGERTYLVREYVPGYTLAAELESGPLPEERILELAKTLAGALDQVHRHGLIHRDVKPSNILLSRDGGVRLIDFGFATQIHASRHSAVGTYLYSAPEQMGVLQAPVDQRSDLYALGAVLYCCATGSPPYKSEDSAELLRRHASAPIPHVRDTNPEISHGLARCISKLLSKDPSDRYLTGSSLLADLRGLNRINQRLQEGEDVRLGQNEKDLRQEIPDMVGRESELRELETLLDDLRRGKGRSALLTGVGGSGKTILCSEFLQRAAQIRPLVLEAHCEHGQPPFATVRDLAEDYFAGLPQLPKVQRVHIERHLREFAQGSKIYLSRLGPSAGSFFGTDYTPVSPDAGDQFLEAVSSFILEISRLHGCVILRLEDVHHLDEGTHQVLKRLSSTISDAPLLLLATCRSGREVEKSLQMYLQSAVPEPVLQLEPLGRSEIELLLFSLLGSRPISPELSQQVAVRSRGNPFASTEYVRAMLRTGVLLPTLEGWKVDSEALQSLALPEDVLSLILQRVATLDKETHDLLSYAAIYGSRFRLEVMSAVLDRPEEEIQSILSRAVGAHIVEQVTAEHYLFVHDRLREAFLSEMGEEEKREMHRRTARGLEELVQQYPEFAYAVARHHALADRESEDSYESNLEAGLMALAEYAYRDAYNYLKVAAYNESRTEWWEPLSLACHRTGRTEQAMELLERLLSHNPEPLEKARYLARHTTLKYSKLNRAQVREGTGLALAAAGKPVKDHPLWNGLACLSKLGWWVCLECIGRKPQSRDRERDSVLAQLYQAYSEAEYFELKYVKMLEMGARACLAGQRLGPSPEMLTSYSNMLVALGMTGIPHLVDRWAGRVQTIAEELGDPISESHFKIFHQVALHMAGGSREVDLELESVLARRGTVTEDWMYLVGVADLAWVLFMRGRVKDAWAWVQRGIERCKMSSSPMGVARDLEILSFYALSCLAVLGRPGEAADYLKKHKSALVERERDRSTRSAYHAHMMMFHRESGELGTPMLETEEAFLDIGLSPRLTPLHRRHFYVADVYSWLDRSFKEFTSENEEGLSRALERLEATANRPILKAHLLCAQGQREILYEREQAALKTLALARDLADLHDMPWVGFEVARARARIFASKGLMEVAQREARRAQSLAAEFGWPHRARAVSGEFALARSTSASLTSIGQVQQRSDEAVQVRLERQLEALLSLSLASAQVLSPYQQARVVLDQLIGLLGAERAYLFMIDGQELNFLTGRDREGQTLSTPAGYSRTVIDTVDLTREPVVLSGTEEGQLMGAESVIAHDLRSIICAPLRLRERFVGVVYLDNKLARGVFTHEDIEILSALSNHIAISMETARASKLEMEVQSERRRRELADLLSRFTTSLSSTLEPEQILQQLCQAMSEAIDFHRATLWLFQNDHLELKIHQGYDREPETRRLTGREAPVLSQVLEEKRPVWESRLRTEPALPEERRSKPFGWTALPIISDRKVAGLVTLSTQSGRSFTENDVEVAFTFCSQAGIALASATLFQEINRLATVDSLTRLFNRRHFFEQAERKMAAGPSDVTVIMMDVDHFKRFNDTYGHAAGDEVLRHVAGIAEQVVRGRGVLGRYGGEEFACLIESELEEAVREVGEVLRGRVESEPLNVEGRDLQVTLSLGAAARKDEETLDQVLQRADAALYEAKAAGRNRLARG